MTFWKSLVPQLLVIATLALGHTAACAIPKAAESEDAPVVIAADVAKPKATAKPAKKEVRKKAPPAAKAKPHNQATVTKKKTAGRK